jgi:RNA polymerase sigma-70 factor (ECF subfamily)
MKASETHNEDEHLMEALRSGDEASFLALVEKYQSAMLRVCGIYLRDPAMVEEVVQDTWLDFLEGLARFEGRSSLKTWLFTILTNNAKTRGKREARSRPFSQLDIEEKDEAAVDPERFLPPGQRWAGHWADKPQPWGRSIEEDVLSRELLMRIEAAIQNLPAVQRTVISLRDVQGWHSEEVCNILGVSETNQRVLLHRARSKVRQALERYFDEKAGRR